MRKEFIYIPLMLLLLLVSACQKEPAELASPEEKSWVTVHLRATVSEGLKTKATLDDIDRHYLFERDDLLYVVDSDTGGDKLYGFLYLISGADAMEAVFEGDLMYFDPISKEPGEPEANYAITATLVSKSQLDESIYTVSNGKITNADAPAPTYGNAVTSTFKEAIQKYSHFTGDATYGDPSFSLSQQSAFIVFTFSFNDDLGSGDLTFTMTNNGGTVRTITVTPNSYKQASFVAAFPDQTNLADATVTISGGGSSLAPRNLRNETLRANRYYNVSKSYVDMTYFTIHAGTEATNITFNYTDKGIQYSADGTNWITATNDPINIAANTSIKVRGIGPFYCIDRSKVPATQKRLFECDKNCSIYGDIMSLFYTDDSYATKSTTLAESALNGTFKEMTNIDILPGRPLVLSATTLNNNCYYQTFYGCTGLTNAPDFSNENGESATTIPRKACYEMFAGCTALQAAPELPANTVENWGYYGMFRGCTSMITPPSRLASNIPPRNATEADNFEEMFRDCTSLLFAPELPASSVPYKGYQLMFSNCTALLAAPELPATTVAEHAYNRMFGKLDNNTGAGCTSMETGPSELPATVMNTSCYSGMFRGCTSLVEAPDIKAETLANACFQQMFQDCKVLRKAQTDFYFTNIANNSCNKMFMGCLALNNAPNMPNVTGTVGEYGCYDMYNNCGELATAPLALNALTVGKGGYRGMFQKCIKIKTAPSISATEVGIEGCRQMFDGCTRLQTPPTTLPATTLGSTAYYQMFNGCSSLKSAPVFPTTDATISGTQTCYMMFNNCKSITELSGQLFGAGSTLSTECFRQMFQNCTSLKTVPQGFLPATTLAESCYRGMFENTAIERAPDLLVETLNANLCYQYMFNKCKSLNYVKCLATNAGDNNGDTYTQNWMNEVPDDATRTFVRKTGAQWASGKNGIPSNWTIEDYPPTTP